MSATLNKGKPYGLIRGEATAKYVQDGKYYDFHGKLCGEVPKDFIAKASAKKAKPAGKRESREDVLARMADTLEDLSGEAPKTLEDAAKENAKALAAEENA